ncbi:uncharacterized protein [Aegilops tauschii subsp. strangulata]|uniref:uncharacterized protein n=1 Tax=Aegilops tauschii subsp. strangulata TaxID=200361 RepID=UPI003CC8C81F
MAKSAPWTKKYTQKIEVRKQSSCSVHLVNRTDEYVAFKVKTTSPKRYCVRPNIGVILPRATMAFTAGSWCITSCIDPTEEISLLRGREKHIFSVHMLCYYASTKDCSTNYANKRQVSCANHRCSFWYN